MKELAEAYGIITDIISNPFKHNLTKVQISALVSAQRAIAAVELIGITINDADIKE